VFEVEKKTLFSRKHYFIVIAMSNSDFFSLLPRGYLLSQYTLHPTTDEWIKKMWYLYTMEFCAAMKKNEMLSFSGKWMELENIILSEVSLAQNTKNRMFSLTCGH
jgi:hypothetical protein